MMTTLTQAPPPPRRGLQADSWLLWRLELPEQPSPLTVADLAECLCPDLCNRDHDNE